MLVSLPVSIEFGINIAAAVQHRCSHQVAIIACMATAAGNRVFQPDCQPPQSAFAAKSGDPETYLNIFEAWLASGRSSTWCSQHCLVFSALTAAEGLLTTALAAMTRCKLKDLSLSSSQPGRSDAIMQSLTTGFFQQTARSVGLGIKPNRQFFITGDYLTNPTSADLHNRSAFATTAGDSTCLVLYFSHSTLTSGKHVIAGVGQVQPEWVTNAAAFDPNLASTLLKTIQSADRKLFFTVISSFPTSVSMLLCL